MNRLRNWWGTAVGWLICWATSAAKQRLADAAIRDLRRTVKTHDHSHRSLTATIDSLTNELHEQQQRLAEKEQEIARLENKLDLTTQALEYVMQWREGVMEQLRAEAAIWTRRRIEAVSGETTTRLED